MADQTKATDPKVVRAKRTWKDIAVVEAKATLAELSTSLDSALEAIGFSEYAAGEILADLRYSGLLVAASHSQRERVWDSAAMEADYIAFLEAHSLDSDTAGRYMTRYLAGEAVARLTDYLDEGSQILQSHAEAMVPIVRQRRDADVVSVMDHAFKAAEAADRPMIAQDILDARDSLDILPKRSGGPKSDADRTKEAYERHLTALAADMVKVGGDDEVLVRLNAKESGDVGRSLLAAETAILALQVARKDADEAKRSAAEVLVRQADQGAIDSDADRTDTEAADEAEAEAAAIALGASA
jgi:hypothetical protein